MSLAPCQHAFLRRIRAVVLACIESTLTIKETGPRATWRVRRADLWRIFRKLPTRVFDIPCLASEISTCSTAHSNFTCHPFIRTDLRLSDW